MAEAAVYPCRQTLQPLQNLQASFPGAAAHHISVQGEFEVEEPRSKLQYLSPFGSKHTCVKRKGNDNLQCKGP